MRIRAILPLTDVTTNGNRERTSNPNWTLKT